MPRKPLSKKLRFSVFDRDGFTCRYCGQSPPTVTLVVDHIIPVATGGTNDDENLATSCTSCNQGKGARKLGDGAPVGDSKRRAQEYAEQIDLAKLAKKAKAARKKFRQEVCDVFCESSGEGSIRNSNLTILCNLCEEFSCSVVYNWIDRAVSVAGSSQWKIIPYVCGCARNTRVQESADEAGN